MNEDESITILDHKITIDDMIHQLYYINDIELSKYNGLHHIYTASNNNNNNFNDIIIKINNKLCNASLIADNKKPIFRILEDYNKITFNNNNEALYNNIDEFRKEKEINNNIIPNFFVNEKHKTDFYNNWNNIILNFNLLFSTLKFKIKEERLTRNLRNDLKQFINNQNKINNDLKMICKTYEQKYNIMKDVIIKNSRNQENINLNIFNNIKRVIKTQDEINIDIRNNLIQLKDIIINDLKTDINDLKEKNKELEDKINENTNNIYYICIGIFIIVIFL